MNERLEFLVERDGRTEAEDWARRTIKIYEDATNDPSKYSALHKDRFQEEIREMNSFLINPVRDH